VRPLAACGLVLLIAAAACGGGSRHGAGRSAFVSASAPSVSALAVVEVRTPTLQVPRYDTSGTYPQVTGGSLDLQSVNAALRAAVVSDQSRYARYARREKPRTAPSERGVYEPTVDRRYLSASTVVVSALLPLTRELFPGQHEGDGWLAMTVGVPSGGRVAISDLFANPGRGLRVLAEAWKAEIRHTGGRSCLRIYPVNTGPLSRTTATSR
jgi:hypothetical protein